MYILSKEHSYLNVPLRADFHLMASMVLALGVELEVKIYYTYSFICKFFMNSYQDSHLSNHGYTGVLNCNLCNMTPGSMSRVGLEVTIQNSLNT